MVTGWTMEELEEANPGRPGAPSTPFRELTNLGAICPAIACEISDLLEQRDQPHMAAFFQLPYPASTEGEWLSVPLNEANLVGELKIVPCRMTFNRVHRFQTEPLGGSNARGYAISQCILLVPYWGGRAKYYSLYEGSFRGYELEDRKIVPQAHSWMHDNRPITAREFESRLPDRMIREVKAALRIALPAMSIVCHRELPIPERLIGYHLMPKAGRIRQGSELAPMIESILESGRGPGLAAPNIPAVRKAISFGIRTFNDFEQHLFAMNSLLDEGEIAAAQIGTVGLMEWMLRYFTNQPDTKKVPFAQVMKDERIELLPSDHIKFLNEQRLARNDLVHGIPLPRSPLVIAGRQNDRGKQIENAERNATVETVSELIRVAFELYRAANIIRPGFAREGLR